MTKRILREKVKIPKKKISDECRSFLRSLICPQAERLTAEGCKNHEWLKEVPWEGIYKGEVRAPIQPRLDRPNIDKNMALVEMMMDEEEKKEKKVRRGWGCLFLDIVFYCCCCCCLFYGVVTDFFLFFLLQ